MVATIVLALEDSSNIIKPDGSLVFIFILFLLFVFVMNRLLFKPVGRVLNQRKALTDGTVVAARASSRLYQTRLAEYEATIRSARADSYRMLEEARTRALGERAKALETVKKQAAEEIENAKAEIARESAAARDTLQNEAASIAAQISRSILGREAIGGAD